MRQTDGTYARTLQDKVARLREGLFPRIPESDRDPPEVFPQAAWPKLEDKEIDRAIQDLNNSRFARPRWHQGSCGEGGMEV